MTLLLLPILLPAATKLGQGNVFTGVCDSVHRGGGRVARHPRTRHTPPRSRHHPPGADTPSDQANPPRPGTPLGADSPPRSRHPPGANTPLGADTPPDQAPPGADTPRTRHPLLGGVPGLGGLLWGVYQALPPRPGTPPGSRPHPPGSRRPHTVNARLVRILLECILVAWAEAQLGAFSLC